MNHQSPAPHPQPDYNSHQNHRITNELAVTQPGETVVVAIKRHPIGLIIMYAGVAVVIIAMAFLTFSIAPGISDAVGQLAIVVFFLVTVLACLYSLIITKVYWGNTWIVTSDSVTQIAQTGLFARQSSQLSLEHIEDVVAEQHGILTHIFDYGLLKVQTAAEHSKFHFPYCPNPNYYAQKILAAREAFHAHTINPRGQHQAEHSHPAPSQQTPTQPPSITF